MTVQGRWNRRACSRLRPLHVRFEPPSCALGREKDFLRVISVGRRRRIVKEGDSRVSSLAHTEVHRGWNSDLSANSTIDISL
jgi:hypothetical protein